MDAFVVRKIMRGRSVAGLLACLCLQGTAGGLRADVTLSSRQLSVTLDGGGVRSIDLLGKRVSAAGGMVLWNDPAITQTVGTLATPTTLRSSSVSAGAGGAVVDQTYDTLHLRWTYVVTGYDLGVDIAVTDTGDRPFDRLFFQLPEFQFARHPDGMMRCWYPTYYAPQWEKLAHPSVPCPLAVADAYDDHFGIAVHCKSHFDRRVLINSNWDHDVIPAHCVPYVYVQDTVQPGATVHVQLNVRITDQLGLADRIGAYVSDFRKWAGPMRYVPDDRPVIGCYPESVGRISRSNPLGLDRRLDYRIGVEAFENMIWAASPYCQGPIFWQPQGANPRGVEYRPDFDVWPPSIQKTLPPLLAWCSARGMRPGLQTRPLTIVTPLNDVSDAEMMLDPDEPTQVAMVLTRFKNTNAAGAREYYLDSFGADLPSYHLMQKLREALGPTIPTYSEYTSDLMLPLSGVYCELIKPPYQMIWWDLRTIQALRLLYPSSSIICCPRVQPDPTTGQSPVTWDDFAAAKLSPIVYDYASTAAAPGLREMHEKYYDGNVWGKAAGSALVPSTQP